MPAWAPPVKSQDVVGTGHKWMEPVDTEGEHKGVDLQAVKGTPALSPVDGVVVDIENDPEGLGKQVHIQDQSGHISSLGHLDQIHVKVGDAVKQGQQVADVGSTGNSTGAHLDVRIKSPQGDLQDPTALLGSLAQMPRADQPAPVGTGQEDEAGNPIGWAAAVQDPYAELESRWQHWPGMMPPTMANPQIPNEQRFWGGPQPQDQLQRFWQMIQAMGPEAVAGWQQMLYGPQGPLAPYSDAAVGGGQDRAHVGTLYRADVGRGQDDRAGDPTDPRYGEFTQESQPPSWRHLPYDPIPYGVPGEDYSGPIPPYDEAPWWAPDYPGEARTRRGVGVGQGQGGFHSPLPAGGVYGAQKWSSPMGSNAVDIFVRRGTPVSAPVSGTIQQGMNGQLILAGDNGWNFAFRHGMTTAQGHVQEGQQIGIVNDPGLDSLGRAPWGNMPDNYQHLEMSVSRGSPNFPGTPGGGGNVDAAQFLNQIGYQGSEIPKTPGPPDAGGGGMGFGGGGGGGQFGGGFNPMSMFGGGGGAPGMGMGFGFPGMPGGFGMPGGGQGGMPGGFGMGMPGLSPGMGMNLGMTSPMGMGQPGGGGMFGDPSQSGMLGGMDAGMGMSTGMGSMDPMAMAAGPQGDFSGWGGGGGGGGGSSMGSMLGGFGGQSLGGFGGFGGQQGFGGMGGQQGFGGSQFGGAGGLGSQMQAPAFSGYPGAMPGTGFSGQQGNPVTSGPADQLMLQNINWKPDWTGVNDAMATLKKNATTPLGALPINTNQLPAAPKSTLGPWDWLNQIYPGSGQDRAVGRGQDGPGWEPPSWNGWDVGVGQTGTTVGSQALTGASTGGVTPTNTPFTGTLTTDPAQALSGNLNQQYFQLAQQQLQQQIQQVNQSFNMQQQQLAQQASQFGMTTQLAQQQQELQQKQFDANQQLQRQLAELQNAQLQQNLGMQSQQFNQQMGLQGAQLGLQAGQFNQQMGLQGAQLGLQQQQLGMLPQQLAAQYGLSAAQLGQGQQAMGIQVQQLNMQRQQAEEAAYLQYQQTGNADQLQRELANQAAKFQQAQQQINQAQYGGNMQLQQQQLRGQTGLSLAQMAQQQQQAGFGRQMDIFNSAMSQPWLQQLSGMAPQWGAAGGPQEAGQAAAAGMPNMPSQGGGINLPDLMQYFPDINVQQYLQGATPQVGPSPFQNNWQSVMSGLGQYSPYNQSPISLPDNPFPFQMPQFSLGQNPYPFNFQPVSSSFNFQPTSVPLEGQMPWAANPSTPPGTPPNPTSTNPNGYQAGPLTFTGQGSMGTPPTSGYNGAGVTYTLPNQQQFGSQDVWNWEQQNAGSSPDQAYQYFMGQHGYPGWDFPVGQGGGFPIGSTVGWNMGATPASGFNPQMPPLPTTPGSGQDRVGSGQSSPLQSGDPTSWGMGPQSGGLGGWANWGGSTGPTDPWQFGSPAQGTSGGLLTGNEAGWGTGFGAWTGQQSDGMGGGDPYASWGTPQATQNPFMTGDPTGWGMGPVQQGGQNYLQQGDPTGWGMGPPQQPPGPFTPDPTGGDGGNPYVPPPAGGGVDPNGDPTGYQPPGNTTLDAYRQYQQALQQWQQQQQAYQQYGQQQGAWQNAWDQFYGNWRQHFGQPGYDTSALAQWRQTNPEPTAVANPGAAPTYQALNPVDFSQWLTNQATNPYQAPAAPTMPNYETFAGMSPFQQAGLRTQAQLAGIAWPQYMNAMRQNWGSGGVTAPPIQSPLTMANLNNNTLNNLSFQNLLSVFGQTPQQYQQTYQPYWSQAQVPGVQGMLGGGY